MLLAGCCIRSSQLVQSILTGHGSCDIQCHSKTSIIEFSITDCSEKSDSPPGTHCVSPSPCVTPLTQALEQKQSQGWVCLLLAAGLTQIVFPNTFLIWTTGTLSLSMVHGDFDWAGPARLEEPQLLANHVVFSKYRSQCLKVPLPIAFNVIFNSPLYHSWYELYNSLYIFIVPFMAPA